jgi:hypothetical protein
MFQQLKQRLNTLKVKPFLTHTQKGQSLVETMIFTPLLIFLLLGVFEIGAALRSYLVMVNVNREITRYSVRPGYLNFAEVDPDMDPALAGQILYSGVYTWVATSLTGQLPLDFTTTDDNSDGLADGNATLIVSHLVVDTGLPCEDITSDPDECDCDAFIEAYEAGETYSEEFTLDDIFIHPGKEGYEFQRGIFGPETTVTGPKATNLDYDALTEELAAANNKFNCEIMKKGGVPSANNVIATEIFYDQPQLFGFPFISNPYTDPVPLYTHTTMRLIGAARSMGTVDGNLTEGIDTIGPVCFAFPTTVQRSVVEPAYVGERIDILDGVESGDWGWLTWNPGEDDENYLNQEWKYVQTSINDYTDPTEWGDHTLNRGDYVTSLNGTVSSIDTRNILESYIGKNLIIPIWDDLSPDGYRTGIPNPNAPPPTVEAYKVWDFAVVRIDAVTDIDIDHKTIMATYLGPSDICR